MRDVQKGIRAATSIDMRYRQFQEKRDSTLGMHQLKNQRRFRKGDAMKKRKKKWGNEFLIGKFDEVSVMIPANPDPNTLVMEYLGDESNSIIQNEINWGDKQFVKLDKRKLGRKIYLGPSKTADMRDSLKESFYQECVLRAPHRIINALAECKIKEHSNVRTTIQSLVIVPREIRELMQEIACLCSSKIPESHAVLLRTRAELWQKGFVARNQLLYEKNTE